MSITAAILRLVRLYRPSRRGLLVAVVLSALQAMALVPVGLLVADAFDGRIPQGDERGLLLDGVALVGLYLLSSALGLLVARWRVATIAAGSARLRNDLTRRLHEMPLSWHHARPAGQVHAATIPELDRVEAMAQAAFGLGPALAIIAPLFVCAIVISPLLTAVTCVVVPVFMLVARRATRTVRSTTRAWQDAWVAVSRHLHTTLHTITLVRTRSADDAQAARAASLADDLASAARDRGWATAVSSTLHLAVASVTGVAVLVVGGTLVSRGKLELGELLAFYAVLALALRQAKALGAASNLVSGTESLSRLLAIVDDPTPPPYRDAEPADFDGSMALEGVTFGFGAHAILRDVDLEVRPGEHVVLVGANGAGKSTIAALLLGLHRPWRGHVLASGKRLDDLDVTRLRRAIGVLPQLLELRPGTIAENVAFGSDADASAIDRALDLAGLRPWIATLPEGSATVIGEGGVQLSGGETQRVALARALVDRPRLLVLDEPTNHLDAGAVDVLLDTLESLRPRPAILTITHEPHIARRADRCVTLVDGRIVEAIADELPVA